MSWSYSYSNFFGESIMLNAIIFIKPNAEFINRHIYELIMVLGLNSWTHFKNIIKLAIPRILTIWIRVPIK